MSDVRVIEIKKSILEENEKKAILLKETLKDEGVFMINVMSSPGSGKTTTLKNTIERLDNLKIGVIEADVDSDVDARTISETGCEVLQIHTGGACHLDANMLHTGIQTLGVEGMNILFVENIGNLICTASFDLGAHKNLVILSVPEGDDKPLKYPHMFEIADVVVVNKIDVLDYFDFDLELFKERVAKRNEKAEVIAISAKTGEGIDDLVKWIKKSMDECHSS